MPHHADCMRKLWQAQLVNPTLHSKAIYKVASRAAHKSALADYNQHFTTMLTKMQQSMCKGNTHPAYKALRQLSKPKCQRGSQLRHGVAGRQLHTVSERIAEWLRHVTQLFKAASPIAPEVLALLPPPPPANRPPLPRSHAGQGCHSHQTPQEQQTPGGLSLSARNVEIWGLLYAVSLAQGHSWHMAH